MDLSGARVDGKRDAYGLKQGTFRYYNADGEIIATAHYRDDLLNGQVITFHHGYRVATYSYKDGLAEGPYRRAVDDGVYTTEGAVLEEGFYQRGISCGVMRLKDAAGSVVASRDFGCAPPEDSVLKGCLAGGRLWGPGDWVEQARDLFAEGRYAEALASLARAVGEGGDPSVLTEALSRVAAPVTFEEAQRRASAVERSGSARVLLSALLRGAEPVLVLRRLAVLSREEASASFLGAAVALREWPVAPILARALRDARPGGDLGTLLEDIRTLELSHPEEAALLGSLARRLANTNLPKEPTPTLRSRSPHADPPTIRYVEPKTLRRRPSAVAASELGSAP